MVERGSLAVATSTFEIAGKKVARLGFGSMRLTGRGIWGEPDDRAECIAVVRWAVELGVQLIDTADSYGPYVAEEIIREALYPYPDDVVIATKAGLTRTGPDVVDKRDFRAVEMSLRFCLLVGLPEFSHPSSRPSFSGCSLVAGDPDRRD